MDNIQIGRLIYEKRKELGLTQQELADRLQITNKAVSKWENGDGMPDVNLLSPLAAELGLTVDELLSGEEKVNSSENSTNESDIFESPLAVSQPSASARDAIIGIIACGVSVAIILSGFPKIIKHLIMHFEYPANFPISLPSIALYVYNIVFWALISAVFICKVLRIQDIDTPKAKGITIAAFIVGIPMFYNQLLDSATINYGNIFFITALLLSECHGYKVPHKIFYGLTILATLGFGLAFLFGNVDVSDLSYIEDKMQFYVFISRIVRALFFYILYGVFEKCCDEYER